MFASQNRFSQTKQALLGIAFAVSAGAAHAEVKVATFAGGCFWCVEKDFDHVPGVVKTISGYTGGQAKDPTYKTVTRGGSGHREAVQIHYDPSKVSYAELLEVFWRSVDPTDGGGQFCDRGEATRPQSFTRTTLSLRRSTNLRQLSTPPANSAKLSQPALNRQRSSTTPKTITRITTKRILYATTSIGCHVAAMPRSAICGATKPTAVSNTIR